MTKDELNETNDEWLERVLEKYGDNITLEEFEKLSLVEQIEYSASQFMKFKRGDKSIKMTEMILDKNGNHIETIKHGEETEEDSK